MYYYVNKGRQTFLALLLALFVVPCRRVARRKSSCVRQAMQTSARGKIVAYLPDQRQPSYLGYSGARSTLRCTDELPKRRLRVLECPLYRDLF